MSGQLGLLIYWVYSNWFEFASNHEADFVVLCLMLWDASFCFLPDDEFPFQCLDLFKRLFLLLDLALGFENIMFPS